MCFVPYTCILEFVLNIKLTKKCTIFIIYGNYVNQLSAIKCVNTAIKIKAIRCTSKSCHGRS